MTYDKASFLAGLRTGLALPRIPKEKPKATYLTFLSEDSSGFQLYVINRTKSWDGTLYYSTDTANWTIWDGTTILRSNGGMLHLRGSGNSKITGATNDSARWVFSNRRIRCVGNIETLLDWETVASGQHPQMAYRCYSYMFSNCQNLTSAPELPATTLAEGCYMGMFNGSTSLTSAPELPATTLAERCYSNMFWGCTSLTTAPKLPATTLAGSCYYLMFYNCTSLTVLPELPATTLRLRCYSYMFDGCTMLKVSETQDSTYAYPYRIPTSGAGTTASGALTDMFSNTGGPLTGTPSINSTYYTVHQPVAAA